MPADKSHVVVEGCRLRDYPTTRRLQAPRHNDPAETAQALQVADVPRHTLQAATTPPNSCLHKFLWAQRIDPDPSEVSIVEVTRLRPWRVQSFLGSSGLNSAAPSHA